MLNPEAEGEFVPAAGDVYYGDKDKNGDPHGRGFFIRRGSAQRKSGWDRWHPGEELYDGFWWHGARNGPGIYIGATGIKLKVT